MYLNKFVFHMFIIAICLSITANAHPPVCKTPKKIPLNILTSESFSNLEKEIIDELNIARQNPQQYIGYLNGYKKSIRGKVLYLPKRSPFLMYEGIPAIDDAISDMQATEQLSALQFSKGLAKVANNQLKDLYENPLLGHVGKDGSNFRTRMSKVGKYEKAASENINYGDQIARQAVMTMIIDDRVLSRAHRQNILNPNFNLIGVSCGKAKNSLMICVLVFAHKFTEVEPTDRSVPV